MHSWHLNRSVSRGSVVKRGLSVDAGLPLDNAVHFYSYVREHPTWVNERQLETTNVGDREFSGGLSRRVRWIAFFGFLLAGCGCGSVGVCARLMFGVASESELSDSPSYPFSRICLRRASSQSWEVSTMSIPSKSRLCVACSGGVSPDERYAAKADDLLQRLLGNNEFCEGVFRQRWSLLCQLLKRTKVEVRPN